MVDDGNDNDDMEEQDELVGMFLEMLKKNISRSRLMSDLWAPGLLKDIAADLPLERFSELYRIISFDILENILTIIPPEEAMVIATNMDHFLQIELLNQRFDIDIMDRFQKEFVSDHGESFPDHSDFSELVARFESDWATTEKEYLEGMTPDDALQVTYDEWLQRWEEPRDSERGAVE